MSAGEQQTTPQEDLAAWRGRTGEFLRYDHPGEAHTSDCWPVEIDIDDMIGAKGRRLEADQEWRDELNPPDKETGIRRHPPVASPNSYVLYQTTEVPTDIALCSPDDQAEHVAAILGPVAARNPERFVEPLERALDQLKNPVRAVAFNYLYFGCGTPEAAEDTAKDLGTSIETVAFLGDVALDIIAAHIRVE